MIWPFCLHLPYNLADFMVSVGNNYGKWASASICKDLFVLFAYRNGHLKDNKKKQKRRSHEDLLKGQPEQILCSRLPWDLIGWYWNMSSNMESLSKCPFPEYRLPHRLMLVFCPIVFFRAARCKNKKSPWEVRCFSQYLPKKRWLKK